MAELASELDTAGSGWLYLPLLQVSLLHTITVLIRGQKWSLKLACFQKIFALAKIIIIGCGWHVVAKSLNCVRCSRCTGKIRPVPPDKVHLRNYSLEVLQSALPTVWCQLPFWSDVTRYYLRQPVPGQTPFYLWLSVLLEWAARFGGGSLLSELPPPFYAWPFLVVLVAKAATV